MLRAGHPRDWRYRGRPAVRGGREHAALDEPWTTGPMQDCSDRRSLSTSTAPGQRHLVDVVVIAHRVVALQDAGFWPEQRPTVLRVYLADEVGFVVRATRADIT